jgi:hypothetical protein
MLILGKEMVGGKGLLGGTWQSSASVSKLIPYTLGDKRRDSVSLAAVEDLLASSLSLPVGSNGEN